MATWQQGLNPTNPYYQSGLGDWATATQLPPRTTGASPLAPSTAPLPVPASTAAPTAQQTVAGSTMPRTASEYWGAQPFTPRAGETPRARQETVARPPVAGDSQATRWHNLTVGAGRKMRKPGSPNIIALRSQGTQRAPGLQRQVQTATTAGSPLIASAPAFQGDHNYVRNTSRSRVI